jgi:hypothetical protein
MKSAIRSFLASLLFFASAIAAQADTFWPSGDWFWIVGDSMPATNVWHGKFGRLFPNTSTDYQGWVGTLTAQNTQASQTTPFAPISGTASNGGSNLIRLLVQNTSNMVTGDVLVVAGNGTVSNGKWTITVIDANCYVPSPLPGTCRVDLQGSTFSGSSESGGVLRGGTKIATMKALLESIEQYNLQLWTRGDFPPVFSRKVDTH